MKNILYLAAGIAASLLGSALGRSQTAPEQSSPQGKLPYVAVHDPEFISPSEATFLHPEDRVIGLMSGRVAKADPAGILSQHGLVEDQSPNGPIAITW